MRILFLGNNWIAWQIVEWLREGPDELVGLVLHPPEKRTYGEEILQSAGVDPTHVFDGSQLRTAGVVEALRERGPDVGVSASFGYILPPEILDLLPAGAINVHPAFLPYNRGAFPNVWSIVEGTPAGATMHYMDEGIDTGDIIAQRPVKVEPTDTGESLYRRLERTSLDLFKDTWPLVRSGEARRTPQDPKQGTYHRVDGVEEIDRIDLDRSYTARELLDLLRARTFPPYPGTYIEVDGRKIYLRLRLISEEDLEEGGT